MDGFLIARPGRFRGNYLTASSSICHLALSVRAARHLCCAMLKKGAGLALTTLATLRHNTFVHQYVHCESVLAQPMTSGRRPLKFRTAT
jgi:hypothetical protein